jgi:hypothetical protein
LRLVTRIWREHHEQQDTVSYPQGQVDESSGTGTVCTASRPLKPRQQ